MPVCNLTTFSCQQNKFKLLSKKFPFEHDQVFCFVSMLVAIFRFRRGKFSETGKFKLFNLSVR